MNATSGGSLFERLTPAANTAQSQDEVRQASLATHLARMLSTRAGNVLVLPDYGLPDLNDWRLSQYDLQQRARHAIERIVERYEPRLCRVKVTALPMVAQALTLEFALEAHVRDETGSKVSFTASLDGRGNISII